MDSYFGCLRPDGWDSDTLPPLSYGSDFSGCDAIACALFALGIKVRYLFATEKKKTARAFLRSNHRPLHLYSDVVARPSHMYQNLDLYSAGPPCEPFSSNGQRQGLRDHRALLFESSLAFIIAARPKAFLLENSHNLPQVSRGRFLFSILHRLCGAGYRVTWSLVNAKDHGLPQYRERIFIIGYRIDCSSHAPIFPTLLQGLTLSQVLCPWAPHDDGSRLPSSLRAQQVVLHARSTLTARQRSQDWAVDSGATLRRALRSGRARLESPCLTHARIHGPWLGSRGRFTTQREMMRLQGLLLQMWIWPRSATAVGQLLGNTIAGCVAQRLLVRILSHTGYAPVAVDPWESGQAQVLFLADASAPSQV